MSAESELRINENVISVLKLDTNSNLVKVYYEPIQKSLEPEFESLSGMFDLTFKDAISIVLHIKNHPKLKVLFGSYNYCSSLNSAFQGIYLSQDEIEKRYTRIYDLNEKIKEEQKKEDKDRLWADCKERLVAYYLDQAYKQCETERKQKTVLAYSHRKVGWSNPVYELNDNFSIELKTNFGYGKSSYFYTRIRYKGVDIIAFSDWIRYEYARAFEIVRYSSKHSLQNESWKEAMEYLSDACNLAATDENSFIIKYMIEECEQMVKGLEDILENDKFSFLNHQRYYVDTHKEGHNLIEFRGEKISGALTFIESILQFNSITEIKPFINRIEDCNRKVHPLLIKEISLIKVELNGLNALMKVLKPKYDRMVIKNEYYSIKIKEFLLLLSKTGKINQPFIRTIDLENRYADQNPEYQKFKSEFEETSKEYSELSAKILSLETAQANIEKYNQIIQSYFN